MSIKGDPVGDAEAKRLLSAQLMQGEGLKTAAMDYATGNIEASVGQGQEGVRLVNLSDLEQNISLTKH